MEAPQDLSTVTDITYLKALAYDEVGKLEQAQQNLRVLNPRIAEVQQNPPEAAPEPPEGDSDTKPE